MIRVSINVSCARCVKELYFTGKEVFSVADVKTALIKIGRGSKKSIENYTKPEGYLESRGFLKRVAGGWTMTDSSMKHKKIEVHIAVGNEYLLGEVSAAITEALDGFRGVTHTVMEV